MIRSLATFAVALLATYASASVDTVVAKAGRLLTSNDVGCAGLIHGVQTKSDGNKPWMNTRYYVFSYEESKTNADMIGFNTKTGTDSGYDQWCVNPGHYIVYLEHNKEAIDNHYALNICDDMDIQPGSFVLLSIDNLGFCDVAIHGDTSSLHGALGSSLKPAAVEEARMAPQGGFPFPFPFPLSMFGDFSWNAISWNDISWNQISWSQFSFDFSFDDDSFEFSSSFDFSDKTAAPTVEPTDAPTNVPTQVLHPTHTPTVSPTSAPTATPTFAPTSLPTVAPTRKPTASPTVSPPPTVAPTRSPTLAPTRKPTASPTMAPTTLLSTLQPSARITECYADCTYKGQKKPASQWTRTEYCEFYKSTGCTASKVGSYSCVPTCLNDCPDAYCDTFSTLSLSCTSTGSTYADKVELEDTCLDTYADTAETETEMEFDSNMAYEGMDATEFANSQDAQDSAIVAMSQSMVGVPADRISITNIEATTRRALLAGAARRLAAGTKVTYKIRTTLEALGYTQAQSTEAYNSLKSQITESVNNGNFMTIFKAAAQEKGVTIVDSATVDTSSVVFSDPTTTIIQTASPTMAPTPKDDDDNKVETGVIIGAVVGSVCGLALLIALVYYLYTNHQSQDQKEMQFRLATQRRRESSTMKDGRDSKDTELAETRKAETA